MPGTLFLVATPIGNLDDVTVRALRVLKDVKLIAAEDTRRTAHLLDRYGIRTPTTSLHQHNEGEKAATLIKRLASGDDIALVSDAGTPAVSDPGARLVQLAIAGGFRVEPVPGPSAVLAALTASGFDTTSFIFLGFPPTKPAARRAWLEKLRSCGGTTVFFEAPNRICETLGDISRAIGDCNVSIGRELTKSHEEFIRGPISAVLKDLKPIGEFTVVLEVGETPKYLTRERPTPDDLASEFGRMTASGTSTRRKALQQLARRYGLKPNEVYEALEATKKSGK
jgi:16S rRNA (cytidine1402-2'-O)-methyltransferase